MTNTQKEWGPSDELVEARFKRWIKSVGTVTLPLLAGFSITSVVVVIDDTTTDFLCQGAAILVLVIAALVLIFSVQCVYHARIYLPKKDLDHQKFMWWAKWARSSYDIGTVALLIGLGLVVAPHPFRWQLSFRLAAVFLVALACVGHVLWALFDPWRRSP